MSEILQAGHHPDADQLNAFVEHALPAHERQQTLAHLAVCPACRQIVALSLPPAEESAALRPELVRKRSFSGWHLAWAGVSALAALLFLVLFIRNGDVTARKPSAPPPKMADAHLPATPPAVSALPVAGRNQAPLPQHSNHNVAIAAADQQARGNPGGVMGGILGGIGGSGESPQSSSPPTPSAATGGPVSALATDRARSILSSPSILPNRLPILSMTSRANQRLAIDTANELFFSNDDGRHWRPVPSPWKGRAVHVALTSAVSFGSRVPAPAMSSQPAPTATTIANATLSGTITDLTGAVIPGATVAATNTSTVVVRSVTTDSHGQFLIANLAAGSYRIEAQAMGFTTRSLAVEIVPAQQAVVDFTLGVASAAQTVMVQASPIPLERAPVDEVQTTQAAAIESLVRFELTTDDGERWVSTDGQTWLPE